MTDLLVGGPVLSTPAEHLFEHVEPEVQGSASQTLLQRTDDDLREIYDIARTAGAIRTGQHKRVALQFPDHMLGDGPRVVALLKDELGRDRGQGQHHTPAEKMYILADTSYSACCVDEIAAQHIDADVVVHYGRSCLSPTSRLPVIYVFTKHRLDLDAVLGDFERQFSDRDAAVLLMADVTYQDHVPTLATSLHRRGYSKVLSTEVVHNPSGLIPNRAVVDNGGNAVNLGEDNGAISLKNCAVYHVSMPPTALLLALSSRVGSFHLYDTSSSSGTTSGRNPSIPPSTRAALGRRYAKVLSLATAGVIGILVNTLSVSNYLSSIESIRKRIATAGKKSYTVVVGKLNPAKLANFAEVDGWVVVGCWESSLVEDDVAYYRPVITPFELEVALMRDDERIWGDDWWGGIERVTAPELASTPQDPEETKVREEDGQTGQNLDEDDDEEESEPPEFDLRTGKLVSHSRPMRAPRREHQADMDEDGLLKKENTTTLAVRAKSDLAAINGVASPGAEFLRSQRTWQGLGSDFDVAERSTVVEQGRSGVARGYTVGSSDERRS